jgi:sec-independent protein translocase protein TatC
LIRAALVATDTYMTFTEHLEELRWCLLKSLAAIILVSGASYFVSDWIFGVMVAPLRESLGPGQSLIGTGVTEAFFVEIKVALAGGIFFSCPFLFYQIWRFISPGLSGSEKRLVLPFILCATLFFFAGIFFCYRVVLPVAFEYFIEQYGTMGVTPAIRIGEYFTFFLVRLGVWNYRLMLRTFRYAIVVIFVLAAMLTPTPDIINQSLLAGPMLLLYVLSIGVAYIWRRPE